jgi:hypothetical protein
MKKPSISRMLGGLTLRLAFWLTLAAICAIWVRGFDREELVSIEHNVAQGRTGLHRAIEIRCGRGGLWIGYGYEDPYSFPDGVFVKRGVILNHQYRNAASYPVSPLVKWARYWHGFAFGPPANQPGGRDYGGRQQYRFFVFPLWVPAFPALACTAVCAWRAARRKKRSRRRAHGQCAFCGYDLRSSGARCPECGRTPSALPDAVPGIGARVLQWGAVVCAAGLFVYLAAIPAFAMSCRGLLGLSNLERLKIFTARAWVHYADNAKLGDECFRILPNAPIRHDVESHFVRLPTEGLWYLVNDGKHTYLTNEERTLPETDPDEVSWHI